MMKNQNLIFAVVALLILSHSCNAVPVNPVYIRINQIGYLPEEIKSAVILSEHPLVSSQFSIISVSGSDVVFTGNLNDSVYVYDKFKFTRIADFSKLKKPGKYILRYDGHDSYPFQISPNAYQSVADSLLLFFSVQRCGPTNPLLHDVCHLQDVTEVIGYSSNKPIDATGGWHDAGDYIKFLSTTAYATYMMLFAYEFDNKKFDFDNNSNGAPDILEEARVGLDWMLRCNIADGFLLTQVQNMQDHGQGFRMPSEDALTFNRPGYVGIGKNQAGLFTAVMALASRIWAAKFRDYEFAGKCLEAADAVYNRRNEIPSLDKVQSGMYQDSHFWGKLALGAVELFITKKDRKYLNEAVTYADSAKSDYWWSWGNINSLAHYKLAKFEKRFENYILYNLIHFNALKNSSVFNEGIAFSWGTTNSMLGVSLQAILYKKITGKKNFDSLAVLQRDYVLGRNPWGLSFIHNIGSQYPVQLHNQVAYFKNGYLPGGLAAGPAPADLLKNYNIPRTHLKYDYFNTDSVKYYDDWADYITNEPTIVGNATALFVFGFYSNN